MLDSGVFPNMQMKVNRSGASSIGEIRKAVNAAWGNDITTAHLNAVAAHVRQKMKQNKKLEGGSWYVEK